MKLGEVDVTLVEGMTMTVLPNGVIVYGSHEVQPGQAETAAEYGLEPEEMNRTHDLAHSLLAYWLGLRCSPSLQAAAEGQRYPHWREEEAAVLALQRFAKAANIDLLSVMP